MLVALGACLAGLVALAVLPAIWRRAVRLTRQAVEATSPMTHADVRAEIGSLRAGHALENRRLASGLERLQAETATNRIARDRAENAANDLRKEVMSRDQALAEASAREDGLRREIQQHEEAVAMAKARQRELERSLKRMMATAGESADTTALMDEAAHASPDGRSGTDASATRASDLARIAGLESEITSLKRKLEAAEQKAGASPDETPGSPEQTSRTSRQRFGQQNNRLFEAESRLIAAQAEITRLSILLEEAGQSDATHEAPAATTAGSAERLTADTERLEGENARLRAELHSNDDFMSLRRELSDLAASVVARLEEPGTETQGPADIGAETSAEPQAGEPEQLTGTDTQQSLSARIRAARKRLKTEGGGRDAASKPSSAQSDPAAKQKAEV
ncbi:hypothetical protein [Stappia sp. ES.058]|uniref:hypothetical protein n=1 Tax=Stappia sp. ES.058 TaxID=1881061 RepID=UPI00087CF3AD|nr:hypothetical protein [Stappia sp. ES.058]SDU34656.1 hypothetical protein SAMN05428979_3128 [Stappia sp. ES.058]